MKEPIKNTYIFIPRHSLIRGESNLFPLLRALQIFFIDNNLHLVELSYFVATKLKVKNFYAANLILKIINKTIFVSFE